MANPNPLENVVAPRPGAGGKDKAKPVKKPKTRDNDPHGYVEFAKSTGPSRKERVYNEEDKGYEAEVDFAKASETGPEVAPEQPEPGPTPVPETPEEKARREAEEREAKRLADLKEKMDDMAELYAKYSGEAYASQGFISRLVGKHKERDVMIEEYRNRWAKAKDEYEKALNNDNERRFKEGKITEKEYRKQTILLKGESLMRKLGNDERKIYYQNKKGEERGWLSKKVEKGLGGLVDKWRKLPFTVKFGAGLALGIIGGPAAVFGLGALRVIGAVAGGKATQEKLQALAIEKRKRDIEKEMRQFEMQANLADVNELHELALASVNKFNGKISEKIVAEANWDAYRKWAGIGVGIAIEELSRLGVTRWMFHKGMDWLGLGEVMPTHEIGGGKGGGVVPEKIEKPFLGDTHTIKSGENMWKVTRDLYMQHADHYGYSDEQVQKLFGSYQRDGILGRLGIRAEDFNDLTKDQKHKIWAEWKTGKEIEFYKSWHGGSIKDLVHAGDQVTMDQNGHIFFGDTSGFKAGYLAQPHDVPQGMGRAAADSYGHAPGGETLEFAPGNQSMRTGDPTNPFAFKMSDGNYYTLKGDTATFFAPGEGMPGAASGAAPAEVSGPSVRELADQAAAMDRTMAHRWMDYIQEQMYGKGTTVDWNQPAREFRNRFMGSFLTSDQPMGPPADVGEQRNLWRAVQEINRRLGPPIGNESTHEWLTRGLEQGRMSSEDMMRSLNRVVNQ